VVALGKARRHVHSRLVGTIPARRLAIAAILTAALAFTVGLSSPLAKYQITSSSMEPTLHCSGRPGCLGPKPDKVLVDRAAYVFLAPKRGDIVLLRIPPGYCAVNNALAVKRIVAGPHDEIPESLSWGAVGSHRGSDRGGFDPEARMAAGRYFVAGDNRAWSCDSRSFGPIARAAIVGEVVLIYGPLNRVRVP